MIAHDTRLVTVACARCNRRQNNGLDTFCRCGHAYARYAPPPRLFVKAERPGARGRKKRKR